MEKKNRYKFFVKPPKIESPDEFAQLGQEYFQQCFDEKEKPTITGLAYHLGFATRQSIYDYAKLPEYSYIIKRMQLLIEQVYEKLVQEGKSPPIFILKNMGWMDESTVRTKELDPFENKTDEELEQEIERARQKRGIDQTVKA